MEKICAVRTLGLIEYRDAYQLQKRLHCKRMRDEIPDILLLLEHPPIVTIGKSGTMNNILVSKEKLSEKGVSLFFSNRGGDATYHGPGQLVGYPIIDLAKRGRDLHRYVRDLEEVLIRTLKDFNIDSGRDENHAGVWTDGEEIAAIGLNVKKWITMHGFALNVNPELEHFDLINPCGFLNRKATSMARVMGHKSSMEKVNNHLLDHFKNIFRVNLEFSSDESSRYM